MIRLALVEDNRVYLNALETYLSKIHDIQLVHLASNLQSMPVLILAKPDVVIMDIDLGTDSGIKGIQLIKEALPHTGIFMLTVFDDEEKIIQSSILILVLIPLLSNDFKKTKRILYRDE